jgi:hypothetical protein
MRRWVAALIAISATGCTLCNVNRATLATSTLGLVCDWGQTRSKAAGGWRDQHEANPVLGETPSTRAVDGYFAGAIAANALLWWLLPHRIKSAVPVAVTAIQIDAVAENLETTDGVCGLH